VYLCSCYIFVDLNIEVEKSLKLGILLVEKSSEIWIEFQKLNFYLNILTYTTKSELLNKIEVQGHWFRPKLTLVFDQLQVVDTLSERDVKIKKIVKIFSWQAIHIQKYYFKISRQF
jgi:hypothetical protein